ncbi:MAG: diguanylate cyclase [Candidatus Riflebacteria bacterium]|nr:diguanylate cyclase [Candidatus Riflebacteria bacterium]
MNTAAKSEKAFESRLNRPTVWLVLFVFFAALPILIYYDCYIRYLDETFNRNRESIVKIFHRELTSFGSKATNRQIFLQQLQGYRDSFRRNYPETDRNLGLKEGLLAELPENASLIVWDNRGQLLEELSQIKSSGLSKEQTNKLIEILLNTHNDFSAGANLQTLRQIEQFEQSHADFFTGLFPLTGRAFSFTSAFTSPNKMFGNYLSSSETFFYWDFMNNHDNNQGGFMAFIPLKDLPVTFGLAQILLRDPSATPEIANGFFDQTTGQIELSYPGLLNAAKQGVALFNDGLNNPLFYDDWVLFVQPMAESTSVNIFSIFSTRSQRLATESQKGNAKTASLILIFIAVIFFYHSYRLASTTGLSLRKKVAGLFLLCMQLPISILIFLGVQFALSQEKLLSQEAETQLIELVKKVDRSAQDHYRATTEWLKSLKSMHTMQQLDKKKLHETFFEFSRNNQLQSFYLIGLDGNIEFDIDNIKADNGNRIFIKSLGMRILATSSDQGNLQPTDTFSSTDSLFDLIAHKTGHMHLVVWPGTNKQNFVYTDVLTLESGERYAIVATIDKTELDRNYLRQVVTQQYRLGPDREIIILKEDDISDAMPRLSSTFKANLLPMLATTRISNVIETDQVDDENDRLLVAIGRGVNTSDFLIGARFSWHKITDVIDMTYLLVLLGIFFSLSASTFLIAILIREFLTPVSVLSSGAKSIISGNLDLELPMFARDELGELAITFNAMTRRLRNRLTELTVLYNLTQKASTTHSQREVFDLAAGNLQKHLNADTSGTAWFNEGEGIDSIYLAEHLPDDESEAIRSCVKSALRTYQSVAEFSEKLDRFVLGVPLFFEEKKFGAVYLVFPEERGKDKLHLSDDEKSFIETLRHHLSLIIEKQRLFEQAITDGLTKLYLRRFFLATLDKEINRSKRYQLDVSVILLDIDLFKKFNDTFGHQAGDYVLRETAQRIMESIRSVDTPGRYGGEEMAVILPQTNIKEAFVVAERMRKAIEGAEYTFKNDSMKVTASLGVSSLHMRDISLEELIEESDKAMYVAKEKGRNQVRIAPEAM